MRVPASGDIRRAEWCIRGTGHVPAGPAETSVTRGASVESNDMCRSYITGYAYRVEGELPV